jgi:hypothetical protein
MRSLLGCGNAIAVWDVEVRSLLGCVDVRSLFGMWKCDRCFGDVGMRSLLGCWDAIAFGDVGSAIAFGNVGCDRCLGMLGVRSLK